MRRVRVISGHWWRVVACDSVLVGVVIIVVLGISARWRGASNHRRRVVVVVHGEIRESGLGKGLGNHLSFFVLQMRVIAHSFLLCKFSGIRKALFLSALNDGSDTL